MLELYYILIAIVMNFFARGDHVREVAAVIKLLEFVLIPGASQMN
jgi:hypothetical protein